MLGIIIKWRPLGQRAPIGPHTIRSISTPSIMHMRLSIVCFYMILNKFDYARPSVINRARGGVRSDTLRRTGDDTLTGKRECLSSGGNISL